MNLIDKFIDKKSILLANGDDIEILKLNIRFNNFKRGTKKLVNYVNYRKILNKINKKKNYDTENLNKILEPVRELGSCLPTAMSPKSIALPVVAIVMYWIILT